MSKAAILAAALVLAPLPALCQGTQSSGGGESSSVATANSAAGKDRSTVGDLLDRLSRTQLKDRLDAAIERVQEACAGDFEDVCGSVKPGGGRIASCMRAHEDELSLRCRLTLFRVARNIKQAVANFADDCGSVLRAQCGNAEKFGECAEQKSAFISPACHTIVTALWQVRQQLPSLKGVTVFSSDGKDVGQVVEAVRGPDGKIQSVQIQIGRLLGLGDKVVTISADQLQEIGDRVRLKLGTDQVRSLPETKRQGT